MSDYGLTDQERQEAVDQQCDDHAERFPETPEEWFRVFFLVQGALEAHGIGNGCHRLCLDSIETASLVSDVTDAGLSGISEEVPF